MKVLEIGTHDDLEISNYVTEDGFVSVGIAGDYDNPGSESRITQDDYIELIKHGIALFGLKPSAVFHLPNYLDEYRQVLEEIRLWET